MQMTIRAGDLRNSSCLVLWLVFHWPFDAIARHACTQRTLLLRHSGKSLEGSWAAEVLHESKCIHACLKT